MIFKHLMIKNNEHCYKQSTLFLHIIWQAFAALFLTSSQKALFAALFLTSSQKVLKRSSLAPHSSLFVRSGLSSVCNDK
jgi:hypothetical protein